VIGFRQYPRRGALEKMKMTSFGWIFGRAESPTSRVRMIGDMLAGEIVIVIQFGE